MLKMAARRVLCLSIYLHVPDAHPDASFHQRSLQIECQSCMPIATPSPYHPTVHNLSSCTLNTLDALISDAVCLGRYSREPTVRQMRLVRGGTRDATDRLIDICLSFNLSHRTLVLCLAVLIPCSSGVEDIVCLSAFLFYKQDSAYPSTTSNAMPRQELARPRI